MSYTPQEQMEDRWALMKVMKAQGLTFFEMVPQLVELGLLECQTNHRRRKLPRGETVCATCENTLNQDWKRSLKLLSADEADMLEVKWAWIRAHYEIDKVCRERAIQVAEVITTRTETVDGKEVTTTTTRKEVRVNVGLLRLRSDVHDKMARFAGYNVDDPAPDGPVLRKKLNVRLREPDEVAN